MTDKITSTDIRAAMRKTFAAPQWAMLEEVPAGTGGTRDNRSADAILMSLWPSRGLHLHGVEIKVSRSDWKREAADPSKAERIATYCDYWWVHTAPGVIQDLAEVPFTWGAREWDGKRWKTLREAVKTEAIPIDRTFLASLMRRTDESSTRDIEAEVRKRMVEAEKNLERERAEVPAKIARGIEDRLRYNTEALKALEAFKEVTGITMERMASEHEARQIGKLVNLIRNSGIDQSYGGLEYVVKQVFKAAEAMQVAMDAYNSFPTTPVVDSNIKIESSGNLQ